MSDELGPTFIETAVIGHWAEALALSHVDPTQAWDEAGGDSLAALQLLVKLEKSLGLKLPFETIRPDVTLAEFIAIAEDAHTPFVADVGPRVFILPGLFGYEAIVRDLQIKLRDMAALEIVELPDMVHGEAAVSSLRSSGRIIAAEIERRQPAGRLFLGGFCFGGAVAYEAASHLLTKGRQVAFLGLLDTPLAAPTWPSWEDLIGFRIRAIHNWRPEAVRRFRRPAATVLVASSDFAPRITTRWRELVPSLRIVVVPGGHADVLRSSLPDAVAAFRNGIADAIARQAGPLARTCAAIVRFAARKRMA